MRIYDRGAKSELEFYLVYEKIAIDMTKWVKHGSKINFVNQ
ncbi:hypothetical protein GM3709_582 [Geminocystis sp. NIES-3709]|nr:hypothetical protein GM3709_582 [Geminocystis sp. NIES-3709]